MRRALHGRVGAPLALALLLAAAACATDPGRPPTGPVVLETAPAAPAHPVQPIAPEPVPEPVPPLYWRVDIEQPLPGTADEYERALRDLLAARHEVGVPVDAACWYTLAADDGRYLHLSPVPDAAALDRREASAELARRLGPERDTLAAALHASLQTQQSYVLRALPELSVHAPVSGAPGHVQVFLEWPRLDQLDAYLDRARRIRDVLQVMGYPITVRAFLGVYGDWHYVYVYEAPDVVTYRGVRPVQFVLAEAVGEDLATRMLAEQDACLVRRIVFSAEPRGDLSALPAEAPAWLWP